jgi:multidrug efflux pump subunit AcrA (membrane-fusion protein)
MSLQTALAAAGPIMGFIQGNKQAKSAKKAAQAQEAAAQKTAAAAEADLSKRNARAPDIASISDKNKIGQAEGGQTLLTGSMGVPSSSLRVMQKSLLGQ